MDRKEFGRIRFQVSILDSDQKSGSVTSNLIKQETGMTLDELKALLSLAHHIDECQNFTAAFASTA